MTFDIVRLVLILCLASCGSPHVGSEPPPRAPEPTRDAVIEGELSDASTNLTLEGGLVSAKSVGRIPQDNYQMSDSAGPGSGQCALPPLHAGDPRDQLRDDRHWRVHRGTEQFDRAERMLLRLSTDFYEEVRGKWVFRATLDQICA